MTSHPTHKNSIIGEGKHFTFMASSKQRAFRRGNAYAPASRHYLFTFSFNLKALSGIRIIGLQHRNR